MVELRLFPVILFSPPATRQRKKPKPIVFKTYALDKNNKQWQVMLEYRR